MSPLPWTRPQVVATVTTAGDLDWLRRHPREVEADLLEIRLDDLQAEEPALQKLLPSLGIPLLLTARHPEEGGKYGLAEERRLELLRRFWRPGFLLDMEIRTLRASSSARDLAREVREGGGWVVASFHDFGGMPAEEVLDRILEEGRSLQGDVVKVAVALGTPAEMRRLAAWAEGAMGPVAAMGMGRLGRLSRLVLGYEVSVLNYGYLNRTNAPGQWKAAELARLLKELRSGEPDEADGTRKR